MLPLIASTIEGRRLSSCGTWRGESGGPGSMDIFAKYGWRPERRVSCGFSRARTASNCRSTSFCMFETGQEVSKHRRLGNAPGSSPSRYNGLLRSGTNAIRKWDIECVHCKALDKAQEGV